MSQYAIGEVLTRGHRGLGGPPCTSGTMVQSETISRGSWAISKAMGCLKRATRWAEAIRVLKVVMKSEERWDHFWPEVVNDLSSPARGLDTNSTQSPYILPYIPDQGWPPKQSLKEDNQCVNTRMTTWEQMDKDNSGGYPQDFLCSAWLCL